ncbi:Uncharacterised protein [Mycobacteroides abscessus]|nr:Uncharacterised protein [Mycobacteroides abscessus]
MTSVLYACPVFFSAFAYRTTRSYWPAPTPSARGHTATLCSLPPSQETCRPDTSVGCATDSSRAPPESWSTSSASTVSTDASDPAARVVVSAPSEMPPGAVTASSVIPCARCTRADEVRAPAASASRPTTSRPLSRRPTVVGASAE